MTSISKSIFAGLVLLPLAAVSAHAADVEPEIDVNPETEAMGFYLRGDAGWSFLDWSGGNDDEAFTAGVGVGLQYNDNFRTDVTVDWAGDYEIAPGADLSTTVVLGNLYLDWANDTAFTPYVGAGLGYGWVDDSDFGNDDGFAYRLTAGVAVNLTDNVALDMGYRFTDIMSDADTQEHSLTAGVRFSF